MRKIDPYNLWIGSAGDARDFANLLALELQAVVALAMEEPPASPSRELIYLRFPLVDGAGNASTLLEQAVESLIGLLKRQIPTFVYCSGGMSRAPVVVAAALAIQLRISLADALTIVTKSGPHDVSAALFEEVHAIANKWTKPAPH